MSDGNKVDITISGHDAQLLAVWQRQNAEILKNQAALLKMGQAGEDAGNKVGGSMQSAIGKIASALGGITSVGAGLTALAAGLKAEYDALLSRQKAAADRQLDTAAAQREAISNLGDDKSLTPAMLNKRVAEISQRTGMLSKDVFSVMSTGLSFKDRGMAAADVVPLAEIAAGLSPESGQTGAANIKAMMAIKKMQPDAGAKDIMGFLLGAKLASPVVTDESFGSYIAPAIAQSLAFKGNTPRSAAALSGMIGQGIGDEEGRVTATAMINFEKDLNELMPKVEGGTMGRLAYLQTDAGKAIKRKLLGPLMQGAAGAKKVGLTTEAKAFTTLAGLVSGEGRYKEMLDATYADTPELAGAGKFVDDRERLLAGDPLQANAALSRMLAAGTDSMLLSDILSGKKEIARSGVNEVLTQAGVSLPNRMIAGFEDNYAMNWLDEDPSEVGLRRIGFEASTLREKAKRANPRAAREMNAGADKLDKVAGMLQELLARGINVNVKADVPMRPAIGAAAGAVDRRAAEGGGE